MADIKVIIPAINEGDSIGLVVSEIPEHVSEIVVVDNGSEDDTMANAKKAGATVITENRTIQNTQHYRSYRRRLFRLTSGSG